MSSPIPLAATSTTQIEWLLVGDSPYHGHPAYAPGKEPLPEAGTRVVIGPLPERFRGRPRARHSPAGYLARRAGLSTATWRTQMPDFSKMVHHG